MINKYAKVSVLIPAYNEEKYIIQTLKALQEQDYPNFEVIVIDNASTDATAYVVYAWMQKHQQLNLSLLHEYRQGTQFARECGRKAATGTIIAQLDADCLPPPHWIATGVNMLATKNTVAVAGPYDYFDSTVFVRTLTMVSQLFILRSLNKLVQLFKKGGVIIGGNVFIKAHVLEQVGGYNTALKFYGDDVDIALRVSTCGHIVFTKKCMVKSSSRRYNASGFFKVQAKYTKAFFQAVFHKGITHQESAELFHPR